MAKEFSEYRVSCLNFLCRFTELMRDATSPVPGTRPAHTAHTAHTPYTPYTHTTRTQTMRGHVSQQPQRYGQDDFTGGVYCGAQHAARRLPVPQCYCTQFHSVFGQKHVCVWGAKQGGCFRCMCVCVCVYVCVCVCVRRRAVGAVSMCQECRRHRGTAHSVARHCSPLDAPAGRDILPFPLPNWWNGVRQQD